MPGSNIITIVLVLIIIIGALYFYNKNKAAKTIADSTIASVITAQNTCVPFTSKQYDDALRNARNKCYPQLAIPVYGVLGYSKCMAKAKEAIPAINIC